MELPDEQRRVIEQFSAFVEETGGERFRASPILVAEDIAASERRGSEEERLGYILLWLLDQAGLEGARVVLEAWTLDPDGRIPAGQPFEPIGAGVRMAYAGKDGGEHLVVYDPDNFDHPDNVLGAAALVVAEIARTERDIGSFSEGAGYSLEDEFYALCLGFGVLVANASLSFESQGLQEGAELTGYDGQVRKRARRLGELGPDRLGALLAVQVRARGRGAAERERVESGLDGHPGRAFTEAIDGLTRTDLDALGLTSSIGTRDLSEQQTRNVDLQRLDIRRGIQEHRQSLEDARQKRNAGEPVFRTPKDYVAQYTMIGAAIGFGSGCILGILGVPMVSLPVAVAATIAGFFYGRSRRVYECSDPQCVATLSEEAEECPRCGGTVAGEIESANQRLEAAEEWREQRELEEGSESESVDGEAVREEDPETWW